MKIFAAFFHEMANIGNAATLKYPSANRYSLQKGGSVSLLTDHENTKRGKGWGLTRKTNQCHDNGKSKQSMFDQKEN